ncbi:hypothetical protein HW555_000586 [Spodoptera exigua]|uniref:Uncharacterized protein n=1 Tax=Spodoptera exigua TaxID=7107 RepID=A0A835GVN5_SPOEX|nr:hypothetical protein HW555_000586 [Spodoptera exigua]
MTKEYYSKNLSELKRAWACPSCTNIARRKNENTPVRNQFEILSEEADMSCDDLLPNTSGTDSDSRMFQQASIRTSANKQLSLVPETPCSISYERFGELLDFKLESIRVALAADIKKEITAAIENLKDEFTRTTDFLASEQRDIQDKLASVDSTITSLESENIRLRTEMNELKRRLQTLEKSSRCRNIEIHSVPERKTENLFAIFEKLCKEIKVSTPNTDILSIRRVAKINSLLWSPISKGCYLKPVASIPADSKATFILDFLSLCNLSQFNHVKNKNERLLDLVLCTSDVICVEPVEESLTRLDRHHPPLSIKVEGNIPTKQMKLNSRTKRYNFNKCDYAKVKAAILEKDWSIILQSNDVNLAIQEFYEFLNGVICKYTPIYRGNKGNLPHWYSPALRRCLLEKIKYHSRFKKYKNPRDYDAFSMLRSRCKKLEKECYRSFVSRTEECLSSNIKCFWKFVNSKKGSNGLPQTMKLDGVISSDGQVIAELFSGFFGSVFENSSSISTDAMEHVNVE